MSDYWGVKVFCPETRADEDYKRCKEAEIFFHWIIDAYVRDPRTTYHYQNPDRPENPYMFLDMVSDTDILHLAVQATDAWIRRQRAKQAAATDTPREDGAT